MVVSLESYLETLETAKALLHPLVQKTEALAEKVKEHAVKTDKSGNSLLQIKAQCLASYLENLYVYISLRITGKEPETSMSAVFEHVLWCRVALDRINRIEPKIRAELDFALTSDTPAAADAAPMATMGVIKPKSSKGAKKAATSDSDSESESDADSEDESSDSGLLSSDSEGDDLFDVDLNNESDDGTYRPPKIAADKMAAVQETADRRLRDSDIVREVMATRGDAPVEESVHGTRRQELVDIDEEVIEHEEENYTRVVGSTGKPKKKQAASTAQQADEILDGMNEITDILDYVKVKATQLERKRSNVAAEPEFEEVEARGYKSKGKGSGSGKAGGASGKGGRGQGERGRGRGTGRGRGRGRK
ncbi:Sas10/Utp3/C1D [Carpediemonas membranifera]|uniref:Sas10/Utp3/C1D n=1 Tax=Carpediemonas membranifera TaxID=201153 RepID=A0A8J6B8Q3_9EUKA|nr:Sas10/Utp3/C1D [Carpediemonas membranifera]|eukprot:KAG9395504.1 Sas10/Utp3/C1D [Carpediemonas membranifera]